jgi:hypothetical protein
MVWSNGRISFLVSVVLLIMAAFEYAHAEGLSPHITTLGPAGQNCETWTQEREKLQRAGVWSSDLKFMSAWITGYLTGANEATVDRGEQDTLLATRADVPAAFAWIDDYCRAQPRNSIYDASASLMMELRKKPIKSRSGN